MVNSKIRNSDWLSLTLTIVNLNYVFIQPAPGKWNFCCLLMLLSATYTGHARIEVWYLKNLILFHNLALLLVKENYTFTRAVRYTENTGIESNIGMHVGMTFSGIPVCRNFRYIGCFGIPKLTIWRNHEFCFDMEHLYLSYNIEHFCYYVFIQYFSTETMCEILPK